MQFMILKFRDAVCLKIFLKKVFVIQELEVVCPPKRSIFYMTREYVPILVLPMECLFCLKNCRDFSTKVLRSQLSMSEFQDLFRQTTHYSTTFGGFLALVSTPLQRPCFLYLFTCLTTKVCRVRVHMQKFGSEEKTKSVSSSLPLACERKGKVFRRKICLDEASMMMRVPLAYCMIRKPKRGVFNEKVS